VSHVRTRPATYDGPIRQALTPSVTGLGLQAPPERVLRAYTDPRVGSDAVAAETAALWKGGVHVLGL
jgi:hypothetical protein